MAGGRAARGAARCGAGGQSGRALSCGSGGGGGGAAAAARSSSPEVSASWGQSPHYEGGLQKEKKS